MTSGYRTQSHNSEKILCEFYVFGAISDSTSLFQPNLIIHNSHKNGLHRFNINGEITFYISVFELNNQT